MRRTMILATGVLGFMVATSPAVAQNEVQPYSGYNPQGGSVSNEGVYSPNAGPYNQGAYAAAPKPVVGNTMESRIGELENQVRNLNGRLEQADWQNKQLRSQLEKMQGDADLRFNALEQRPAAAPAPSGAAPRPVPGMQPYTQPPRSDAADDVGEDHGEASNGAPVSGQLGNLYVNDNQVKGADSSGKAPTLPKTPAGYGLTPKEQYDQAFALLRAASYDEAEAGFRNFIEKNPKDRLIDNAKYWLGETHYVRGKFDSAAVSFADAYQTAPKGSKAPDSLLKLGLSLAGMGKHADACTTLAEVKNKFPNASAAVLNRGEQEIKETEMRALMPDSLCLI